MLQTHILELIQQLHPEKGDTELRVLLNEAQREFCMKTELVDEKEGEITTDGEIYYNLTELGVFSSIDDLIRISRVNFDGKPIRRLSGAENLEGY